MLSFVGGAGAPADLPLGEDPNDALTNDNTGKINRELLRRAFERVRSPNANADATTYQERLARELHIFTPLQLIRCLLYTSPSPRDS